VLGDDTPVNVDKGNTPLGKGYDVLAVSSNHCNLTSYTHATYRWCTARDPACKVRLA
jgi:hypothetical protein